MIDRCKELVVSDAEFDKVFPPSQRLRSHFYWTPVDVAVRACALLAPNPTRQVLDVGSGVGKLCLVGALINPSARWCGIERDATQVRVAHEAARHHGVEQHVQFMHGDFAALDWTRFDAFYFFNPFSELLLDFEVETSERWKRHRRAIDRARDLLASTPVGTRVVTYHGFGGELGACFELVQRERAGRDELCLWIKRA